MTLHLSDMSEMQLLLLDLKHLILKTLFVLYIGGKQKIGEKIPQFFLKIGKIRQKPKNDKTSTPKLNLKVQDSTLNHF